MAEPMNEEQLKALQEKLRNMSPEELREFQKKQCIFCQIISGKIQAKKIYEDDKVVGILDINPANPGHTLLLTKEHYSIMPQVPDEDLSYISMVVKSMSNSMLRSIDAQGTNVLVANGIAAGQRAQHFMVHLIPRKENDGVDFVLPQRAMEQNDIDAIGNKLIAAMGGAAGKEEKPVSPVQAIPIQKVKAEVMKPVSPDKRIEPKKEAKPGINLDDISRLLGVK